MGLPSFGLRLCKASMSSVTSIRPCDGRVGYADVDVADVEDVAAQVGDDVAVPGDVEREAVARRAGATPTLGPHRQAAAPYGDSTRGRAMGQAHNRRGTAEFS